MELALVASPGILTAQFSCRSTPLLQNVADHLSSRAYMELASRFPARRRRELAAAAEAAQAGGGNVDAGWLNCEDSVDWEAVRIASSGRSARLSEACSADAWLVQLPLPHHPAPPL